MNDLNSLPETIHQYTKYEIDNYDRPYLFLITSEIKINHDGKITMDIMRLNDKFLDGNKKALYNPVDYEFYFLHAIHKRPVTI